MLMGPKMFIFENKKTNGDQTCSNLNPTGSSWKSAVQKVLHIPIYNVISFVQIIAWNLLVIHKSKWFQKPTLHDHIFKRVVTQCRSLVAGMAVMMMMPPHLPGLVQVHGAMMKLIVVSLTPNLVRIHLGFLASVMVSWVIGCWPKKTSLLHIIFWYLDLTTEGS